MYLNLIFHTPVTVTKTPYTKYFFFFDFLSVDTSTKTVGYKEGSGFTHAYSDEPITFNPMEAHEGMRDVKNEINNNIII